jgi:hypothetical protein
MFKLGTYSDTVSINPDEDIAAYYIVLVATRRKIQAIMPTSLSSSC